MKEKINLIALFGPTASGKTREEALIIMKPTVTRIAEILGQKIAWVREEV